ncbi:MAG: glycosyltransferase family 2 protein [Microbacteriaceae bacterium]
MTVRVSVALATYHGERFIAEQLASILAQTVPVSQIVIADDGSSDATLAVAQEVLAGFTGELLILPAVGASLGVTRNFERALRACTGECIALCDQDDVWHPDKIERMLAVLGDGLLACSDARLVGDDGEPLDGDPLLFGGLGMTDRERSRLRAGNAWPVLLRRNLVTGATVLLRRALLGLAGEFPDAWVHDEWLAIVAAAHGGVRLLEMPMIDYRQHGANQIGVRSKLTWRIRAERLRAPRTERNARLLARAEALVDWARHPPAAAQGAPGTVSEPAGSAHMAVQRVDGLVADAEQKLAHERVRSALPAARFARLAPVLRERSTGRYDRFGLGSQDVLRDLAQPV